MPPLQSIGDGLDDVLVELSESVDFTNDQADLDLQEARRRKIIKET